MLYFQPSTTMCQCCSLRALPRYARHAIQAQELEPLHQRIIAKGDGAAFSAGEVLGAIEAEAS
jgi:hypothetical protein